MVCAVLLPPPPAPPRSRADSTIADMTRTIRQVAATVAPGGAIELRAMQTAAGVDHHHHGGAAGVEHSIAHFRSGGIAARHHARRRRAATSHRACFSVLFGVMVASFVGGLPAALGRQGPVAIVAQRPPQRPAFRARQPVGQVRTARRSTIAGGGAAPTHANRPSLCRINLCRLWSGCHLPIRMVVLSMMSGDYTPDNARGAPPFHAGVAEGRAPATDNPHSVAFRTGQARCSRRKE